MTEKQKEQIEKKAEEKCKLINPVHRDCYVSGFISGARMFLTKYIHYKELYENMKLKNMEMLERMDNMSKALDQINCQIL